MIKPLTHLGDLPLADFFKTYWQKAPVILPAALPGFVSPLTPDELAGLALDDDIESRLVTHSDTAPWQLHQGPFSDTDFARLPANGWTLLVQAVDQWVPEVAELLDQFRFIPNWRLDDIMVSYAPTGGSVGPHYDYYDVFLVQGAGRRRWQIGQYCNNNTPLLDGTPLKIVKHFESQMSYDLEPGDVLYIPPGVAHWGTALDDYCMTYSVGFRAPSHQAILTGVVEHVAESLTEDQRYCDAFDDQTHHSGEISHQTIAGIRQIIEQYLTDDVIASWFGASMSEAKYPVDESPDAALGEALYQELVSTECALIRPDNSRFCYYSLPTDSTQARLFADGQEYLCSIALACFLSEHRIFSLAEIRQNSGDSNNRRIDNNTDKTDTLLKALLANGSLLLDSD